MDVRAFLDALRQRPAYGGQIVHERFIPPRTARFGSLNPPLPEALVQSLEQQGITRLYRHQADAVTAVRNGEHIVVVTATASGKTLCYNLPVLETMLTDPRARALYLFPTKALAQDQADALGEFGLGLRFGTYDGDTPQAQRRRLREDAQIILTNPDMLHVGILPQHFRWAGIFKHLRYVVIDDAHIYRGVFGSNVANVIRRLRRVCRLHGSDPVFICTSATIGNPEEFAGALLGLPARVVDQDGSPVGPRWFVLWNPPIIDQSRARRRSTYSEATALFTDLVSRGVRTIAFTQARKIAELIYRYSRDDLESRAPELAGRISPYRAGYLPEERRAIEQRLFGGDLLGVVSTSALELGIDVGGLDAALLVGYPGTIASTWQRAGRAGRGQDEALVMLIALEDALDQYLMRNPDYLFDRPIEHAVIDPENPYILAGHLRCATAEVPLWEKDAELFGPRMSEIARILTEHGDLISRRGRWYWTRTGYPARDVEVRSASGETFRIIDAQRDRLVGTVDAARAFEQVHPGAIYLHQGEPYLVGRLDLEQPTHRTRQVTGVEESRRTVTAVGQQERPAIEHPLEIGLLDALFERALAAEETPYYLHNWLWFGRALELGAVRRYDEPLSFLLLLDWSPLRDRLPASLADAPAALERERLFHEYVQWLAAEQWATARRAAATASAVLRSVAFTACRSGSRRSGSGAVGAGHAPRAQPASTAARTERPGTSSSPQSSTAPAAGSGGAGSAAPSTASAVRARSSPGASTSPPRPARATARASPSSASSSAASAARSGAATSRGARPARRRIPAASTKAETRAACARAVPPPARPRTSAATASSPAAPRSSAARSGAAEGAVSASARLRSASAGGPRPSRAPERSRSAPSPTAHQTPHSRNEAMKK